MASTGVSWLPLCARLESRGYEGLLVDPHQVQKLRGCPKSDGHDGQGKPRLPTCGLLARACRPADPRCVRRRSLRQRAMLLPYAGQPIQPRQTVLTPMHRKLQHVVVSL